MFSRELFVAAILLCIGRCQSLKKLHGHFVRDADTLLDVVLTMNGPEIAQLHIFDGKIKTDELISSAPELANAMDRICIFEEGATAEASDKDCLSLLDAEKENIPGYVSEACEGRQIVKILQTDCHRKAERGTKVRVKRQSATLCLYYKLQSFITTERYCCRRFLGTCRRYCRRTRVAYRKVCDFSRLFERIPKLHEIARVTFRPPINTLPPITPPVITPPNIGIPHFNKHLG